MRRQPSGGAGHETNVPDVFFVAPFSGDTTAIQYCAGNKRQKVPSHARITGKLAKSGQ